MCLTTQLANTPERHFANVRYWHLANISDADPRLSAYDPNRAYKEEEGPLRVALAAIPPTQQPRV